MESGPNSKKNTNRSHLDRSKQACQKWFRNSVEKKRESLDHLSKAPMDGVQGPGDIHGNRGCLVENEPNVEGLAEVVPVGGGGHKKTQTGRGGRRKRTQRKAKKPLCSEERVKKKPYARKCGKLQRRERRKPKIRPCDGKRTFTIRKNGKTVSFPNVRRKDEEGKRGRRYARQVAMNGCETSGEATGPKASRIRRNGGGRKIHANRTCGISAMIRNCFPGSQEYSAGTEGTTEGQMNLWIPAGCRKSRAPGGKRRVGWGLGDVR